MLSPEEERALVEKAQGGDTSAEERLVVGFNRLILSERKKFIHKYGLLAPPEDIEQEARKCLLMAIRAFDPSKGFRLGTLAKTIIARRLPRQVYRCAPRGDALSHGEEVRESELSATQPRPLSQAQQAALIELANLLRQVRRAALTSDEQQLIRVHYDDGDNVSESAHRLGISRVTFNKRHNAAISAMHDTLVGMGFSYEDARVYFAILSRDHAPRTAPKPTPTTLEEMSD